MYLVYVRFGEIAIVLQLVKRYGKISTILVFDVPRIFSREEHRAEVMTLTFFEF
jgi:hypothetical protein